MDATIFILPQKFQRKRLEDIKISMRNKNINFVESLSPKVTHIVTEYVENEQVKSILIKEGLELPACAIIINTKWLTECLKLSKIVPVLPSHRLKHTVAVEAVAEIVNCKKLIPVPEWACQRVTRLDHMNGTFSNALEVLQENAVLRDGSHDYSRALAFRRASCVLKSLTFKLSDIKQLEGVRDIGDHVKRVLHDLIIKGYSTEVEEILNSSWYERMKLFTSVFGVGPSTAKKWIDKGFETIQSVRDQGSGSTDWRVAWGLAFLEDLNNPVQRYEAEAFLSIVSEEAEKLLPGVIVQLCGGFRRGKTTGHDVDILLSHPSEGKELGLLPRLLQKLKGRGLVLVGHKEKNSFRQEHLYQDTKLNIRGQLDGFEKWIGICKFPKPLQTQSNFPGSSWDSDRDKEVVVDKVKCLNEESKMSQYHSHYEEEPFAKKQKTSITDYSIPGSLTAPNEDIQAASKSDDHIDANPDVLTTSNHYDALDVSNPNIIAASARSWIARRVDLIISPYSQYFFALLGWTGSKHFNRDARLYAQRVLGLKLTSHGLYDLTKHSSVSAFSEKDIFEHLKLSYREPFERNC